MCKTGCNKTTWWAFALALATSMIIIGAIMPTVVDKMINSSVSKGIVLNTYSMTSWNKWVVNSDKQYKVYLFNITNLYTALTVPNTKLNLVERGPYTFTEVETKYNISFFDSNTKVQYNKLTQYVYDASQSGAGLSLSDKMVFLNIPYLGAVSYAGKLTSASNFNNAGGTETTYELMVSQQAFSTIQSSITASSMNYVIRYWCIPVYLNSILARKGAFSWSTNDVILQWYTNFHGSLAGINWGQFELPAENNVTAPIAAYLWNSTNTFSFFNSVGAAAWAKIVLQSDATTSAVVKNALTAVDPTANTSKVFSSIVTWMGLLMFGPYNGDFRKVTAEGLEAAYPSIFAAGYLSSTLTSWAEWGYYQMGTGAITKACTGYYLSTLLGYPSTTVLEFPTYSSMTSNTNTTQVKNFMNWIKSASTTPYLIGFPKNMNSFCTDCGMSLTTNMAFYNYSRNIGETWGVSSMVGTINTALGTGSANGGMFTYRTVREYLFGYADALASTYSGTIGANYSSVDAHYVGEGRYLKSQPAYAQYTGYDNVDINSRWYRFQDNTVLQNVTQLKGRTCNSNPAYVVQFREDCKLWNEPEMIDMTYDGTAMEPFQESTTSPDMAKIWIDDVKRAVTFKNTGETITYRDVKLRKFIPNDEELLMSYSKASNYGMYPTRSTSDFMAPLIYSYGADFGASFPHFYRADSSVYSDYLDGITPNADLHHSEVDVEPLSGRTMLVYKRLQSYARFDNQRWNSDISPYRVLLSNKPASKPLYVPLYWACEEASISESDASDFVKNVYGSRNSATIALGVLVALGSVLFILSIFMIIQSVKSMDKNSTLTNGIPLTSPNPHSTNGSGNAKV